jgi:hypothetical protein
MMLSWRRRGRKQQSCSRSVSMMEDEGEAIVD